MSATIRDVAKLAGVSASTVSRVINKSAPISGETTERIYRAMEELKYVPNDIARSFASAAPAPLPSPSTFPTRAPTPTAFSTTPFSALKRRRTERATTSSSRARTTSAAVWARSKS